jgi:hypothetical protein
MAAPWFGSSLRSVIPKSAKSFYLISSSYIYTLDIETMDTEVYHTFSSSVESRARVAMTSEGRLWRTKVTALTVNKVTTYKVYIQEATSSSSSLVTTPSYSSTSSAAHIASIGTDIYVKTKDSVITKCSTSGASVTSTSVATYDLSSTVGTITDMVTPSQAGGAVTSFFVLGLKGIAQFTGSTGTWASVTPTSPPSNCAIGAQIIGSAYDATSLTYMSLNYEKLC